jgi:hypothetical protein
VKSSVLRTLAVGAILIAAVYCGDYLRLRHKIVLRQEPFGSVKIESYTSIQEKNNRVEYRFGGAEVQSCARSIFPHFGYTPCWYLRRHAERKTEL